MEESQPSAAREVATDNAELRPGAASGLAHAEGAAAYTIGTASNSVLRPDMGQDFSAPGASTAPAAAKAPASVKTAQDAQVLGDRQIQCSTTGISSSPAATVAFSPGQVV